MTQLGSEQTPRTLPHTWDEARQLAFEVARPLPLHDVPLERALGRKLGLAVLALHPMPHYASSAMDGWAVAGSPPWILSEPGKRLSAGQAVGIRTGGVIPPGAKSVLRSESGEIKNDDDGLPVLLLGGGARPGEPKNGQHIRPAGEEAAEGEELIKAGTVLNPAHIALAALGGNDFLSVLGEPTVQLVLTGDEVISAGIPLAGEVRDAFSPQLGRVVELLGGKVVEKVRAEDSLESMLQALEEAPDNPADVLITTGGTGNSAADFLRRSLESMGATFHISGIAMRPGHPTILAELADGRFVLGLPGNPLAAMTALFTIGGPLLAKLGSRAMPALFEVPCGVPIKAFTGPSRLTPYKLVYGLASPRTKADSAMMRGLAEADGIMVVPPHGLKMGENATAFSLPWT